MRYHRHARQRGVALLAVSLLLVVVGALAYVMSRQGAMAANAVNAQYDAEKARYLAEAGLNVARWRDQQTPCKKSSAVIKPGRVDSGGSYTATLVDNNKTVDITAVGATDAGGAQVTLARSKLVAHTNLLTADTLENSAGTDTYISSGSSAVPLNFMQYVELNQGTSNILLQFKLPGGWDSAIIAKAELTMNLYSTASALPGQVVSVHRVTRSWTDSSASWTYGSLLSAWSTPGGDYVAANAGATTIGANGAYVWDVTSLVDGWVNGSLPNYGLLMRADGPSLQARFYGFQSSTGRPVLRVSYYKAC